MTKSTLASKPGQPSATSSTSMAARRSKRIVTSESPDSQTDTQHLSDQDDESEPGDDASMLDEAADKTALSAAKSNNSQPSTSTRAKPPAGGLKVRLKLANPPPSSPTLTPAAPGQRASSSRKREVIDYTDDNVNEDDLDELEDRPVRGSKRQKSNPDISTSASDDDDEDDEFEKSQDLGRMTARQRSRHDAKFTEDLLVLPEDNSKKIVLTEQEKLRRKEDIARRRKLQADQKQENDKRDAIDRLLKAQTGRTRTGKESRDETSEGPNDTDRKSTNEVHSHLIRMISSVSSGELSIRMAIPEQMTRVLAGIEEQAAMPPSARSTMPTCNVAECTLPRKYRCVQQPSIGGCSLAHLRTLNETLSSS